jgi:hypothetical protein
MPPLPSSSRPSRCLPPTPTPIVGVLQLPVVQGQGLVNLLLQTDILQASACMCTCIRVCGRVHVRECMSQLGDERGGMHQFYDAHISHACTHACMHACMCKCPRCLCMLPPYLQHGFSWWEVGIEGESGGVASMDGLQAVRGQERGGWN